MRIKNKSAKIITIGEVDILPDKVVDLDEATANNPVIALFIKNGFLAKVPTAKVDDKPETPDDIAARVKKIRKKDDVTKQLDELGIEYDKDEKLEDLKQKLIEALV